MDDASQQTARPRRIGAILVERQLITPAQLTLALDEQITTGRPLGEICVSRFGLDRLSLADALAEQWEELQASGGREVQAEGDPHVDVPEASEEAPADDELRVLLEEAEAARAELAERTEELSQRLAALEAVVVGVNDALAELRNGSSDHAAEPPSASPKTSARTKRGRARGTTTTPRSASA